MAPHSATLALFGRTDTRFCDCTFSRANSANRRFSVRFQKKSKIVEIAEYVLPKFDVSIDAPAELSAKDGKIRAIIRSKYTYGKHVKGDAIVSLTPSETVSYYGYASSQAADSVLKTAKIDGKGSVEFSVDDDLRLDFSENKRDRYYQLRATVIEELTGQNQSVTKDITIHASRYNVEASALSHDFNPGLPLTFSVCAMLRWACARGMLGHVNHLACRLILMRHFGFMLMPRLMRIVGRASSRWVVGAAERRHQMDNNWQDSESVHGERACNVREI